MEFTINYTIQDARKMLLWLIGLELAFVFVYIATHIILSDLSLGPVRTLFDLNGDLSIPAWFSSIQLFATGVILFAASRRNQRKHHLPSSFLMAASLGFIFLSMDEGAAIHEKITIAARKLELTWLMFEGRHGAWIIIYSVIAIPVVLLAARYFRMAWKHFRRETLIAVGGAALFVTGAVGLEIISYLFLRSGSTESLYKAEVIFEEFFEMSGISIILYAVVLLATTINSLYPAEVPKEAAEGIQI